MFTEEIAHFCGITVCAGYDPEAPINCHNTHHEGGGAIEVAIVAERGHPFLEEELEDLTINETDLQVLLDLLKGRSEYLIRKFAPPRAVYERVFEKTAIIDLTGQVQVSCVILYGWR